jgi:hypothetical protein
VMDLSPGSEASRLTRAACTLVTNIYPLGYTHFPNVEESLRDSRCIETSRALVETLKHFGIPARLMPVDIIVNNVEAYRQKQQSIPIQYWPDDAWSVGIVDDPNVNPQHDDNRHAKGKGWDGHMLVRVAREWLCDPNAGQFHREGKIHMPPGWTIRYPEDWHGDEWTFVGIISSLARGPDVPEFPILQIRSRPDNLSWKRGTAATTDVSHLVETVAKALERLREDALGETFYIQQGDEVGQLDVSAVIRRYKQEASQ